MVVSSAAASRRVYGARSLAAFVIARVVGDGAFAAAALDAELGRAIQLSARDRALVTQLVYGTLRVLPWLQGEIARFAPRGIGTLDARVRAHLAVAAYQLFFTRVPAFAAVNEAVDAIRSERGSRLASFANACLRKVATRAASIEGGVEEEEEANHEGAGREGGDGEGDEPGHREGEGGRAVEPARGQEEAQQGRARGGHRVDAPRGQAGEMKGEVPAEEDAQDAVLPARPTVQGFSARSSATRASMLGTGADPSRRKRTTPLPAAFAGFPWPSLMSMISLVGKPVTSYGPRRASAR